VGLLAAAFLAKEHGARIVHDPRVVWNTQDIVATQGGVSVQSRTGHAFVKQVMRDTGAVYGGEMSAHHYFRDFSYCDSGMIPFLLISELISRQGALADLVAGRKAAFPSSGEINFRLPNAAASLERVREMFEPLAETVDETDGLSLSFGDWRMNLRSSNTEPLVRLNIESRGNADLLPQKLALIFKVLQEG
jgi:phosphomannomutase